MTTSLTTTKTMISIVADTNQILSAFVYHGMMKSVFDLVMDRKLTLYVSPALKSEMLEKLQFFKVSQDAQDEVMLFFSKRGIFIEPGVTIAVCRDREDNFALELSEASRADYFITRDKDLLDIHRWKQTEIIKPEDFLPLL